MNGITIYKNSRSVNDGQYKIQHMIDNNRISQYTLTNYRTQKTVPNPHYQLGFSDNQYQFQSIYGPQGAGANAPVDSMLTRGHIVHPDVGRLSEHNTFHPFRHTWLPQQYNTNPNPNYFVGEDAKMFQSTSLSIDPQRGYDPCFRREGVNTSHYSRYSDEHFKKLAGV